MKSLVKENVKFDSILRGEDYDHDHDHDHTF